MNEFENSASATVKFHFPFPGFDEKIRRDIKALGADGAIFRESHFVDMDSQEQSHQKKLEKIAQILMADSGSKIFLSVISSLDNMRTEASGLFDLAFSHDNVRAHYKLKPLSSMLGTFELPNEHAPAQDFYIKILGLLRHHTSPDKMTDHPETYKSGITISRLFVNKFFPSQSSLGDEELVQFIRQIKFDVPEVMKGQKIEGVYCDIEGTLVVNGKLNQACLARLREYEGEGKQITLWTLGDVNALGKKLKELGLEYPLKSKIDFAGAEAEVVVDDMSQEEFVAVTKIIPAKFVNVSEFAQS